MPWAIISFPKVLVTSAEIGPSTISAISEITFLKSFPDLYK